MSFPFDFGFIPGTRGSDGDPLDVLILMDAPAYPGCLVTVALLGVIEATQSDGPSRRVRNDRLVALAHGSTERGSPRELKDIDAALLDQIEAFFVDYTGSVDGPSSRCDGEACAAPNASWRLHALADHARCLSPERCNASEV